MKAYHLAWIFLSTYAIEFVGWLLMILTIFWASGTLLAGAGLLFLGMSIRWLVGMWLEFKERRAKDHATSPMGQPVPPSGVLIDPETPLGIGSRVLLFASDAWYRGIIIRVKTRDRFMIRLVGWDPFWDTVRARSDLQVDDSDRTIAPTASASSACVTANARQQPDSTAVTTPAR